jgi:hypothetical protein
LRTVIVDFDQRPSTSQLSNLPTDQACRARPGWSAAISRTASPRSWRGDQPNALLDGQGKSRSTTHATGFPASNRPA